MVLNKNKKSNILTNSGLNSKSEKMAQKMLEREELLGEMAGIPNDDFQISTQQLLSGVPTFMPNQQPLTSTLQAQSYRTLMTQFLDKLAVYDDTKESYNIIIKLLEEIINKIQSEIQKDKNQYPNIKSDLDIFKEQMKNLPGYQIIDDNIEQRLNYLDDILKAYTKNIIKTREQILEERKLNLQEQNVDLQKQIIDKSNQPPDELQTFYNLRDKIIKNSETRKIIGTDLKKVKDMIGKNKDLFNDQSVYDDLESLIVTIKSRSDKLDSALSKSESKALEKAFKSLSKGVPNKTDPVSDSTIVANEVMEEILNSVLDNIKNTTNEALENYKEEDPIDINAANNLKTKVEAYFKLEGKDINGKNTENFSKLLKTKNAGKLLAHLLNTDEDFAEKFKKFYERISEKFKENEQKQKDTGAINKAIRKHINSINNTIKTSFDPVESAIIKQKLGLEEATKVIKENQQESTAAVAIEEDPNNNNEDPNNKKIEGSGLKEDLDTRLASFKNLLLDLFSDDRLGYKSANLIIKEFYDDTMKIVNKNLDEALQKSTNNNTITVNTNVPNRELDFYQEQTPAALQDLFQSNIKRIGILLMVLSLIANLMLVMRASSDAATIEDQKIQLQETNRVMNELIADSRNKQATIDNLLSGQVDFARMFLDATEKAQSKLNNAELYGQENDKASFCYVGGVFICVGIISLIYYSMFNRNKKKRETVIAAPKERPEITVQKNKLLTEREGSPSRAIQGKGLMDATGPSQNLQNMLMRYGDIPIIGLSCSRSKLAAPLNYVFGKLTNYDNLYHLCLYVKLSNGLYFSLEKNPLVTMNQITSKPEADEFLDIPVKDIPVKDIPVKDIPVKDIPVKDIPVKDIPINNNSTLNQTFKNLRIVFPGYIWRYDMRNNCQAFLMMFLRVYLNSNPPQYIIDFILQDKVQNYNNPFVMQLVHGITSTYGTVREKLLGGNVFLSEEEATEKYLQDKQLEDLDKDEILDEYKKKITKKKKVDIY